MAMSKSGRKGFEVGSRGARSIGMAECPICGRDHHCWAFVDGTVFSIYDKTKKVKTEQAFSGAVLCMAPPITGDGRAYGGYVAVGEAGKSGSQHFVPAGAGAVLSDADLELRRAKWQRDQEEAARKAAETREFCRKLWASAIPHDSRIAAYFLDRGVAVMSSVHRYVDRLAYKDGGTTLEPGPAILAPVTNAAGELVGLQRIYLAIDGGNRKRVPKDCGKQGAKMALGTLAGGAVRLGGVHGARTLVLCEGIETGEMIRAASPMTAEERGWKVLACVSGSGLMAVELADAELAGVTRIVIAGDLDKWDDRKAWRPGHHYAAEAAERLREKFPALDVRVAIPGYADCPEMVEEGGAPRGLAGSDWLDVGAIDLRRVTRAMLGAPSDALQPGKAEWEEARTRASAQGSPDEGMDTRTRASAQGLEAGSGSGDGSANRTRASAPGSPDEGEDGAGDRTRASAQGPEAGDEGGGGDADDGGDGATWNPNGHFVTEDGKNILPKGDLTRARIIIRSLFMPEGEAAGQRFTLAWWEGAQQWLRFDGKRYEQVHADELRGIVLDHFERWVKKNADGTMPRAALSTAQAASIVEALKSDCTIKVDGLPAWAPPTIGSDGRPLFDTRRERPEPGGLFGRPVIVFQNGLLDLDALRQRREIHLSPHTTLRVSTTAMPYALPVEAIRAELEADPKGECRGGELCAKLAPEWIKYMTAVSKGDDDVPRCIQQYLGYILSPTCEYEKFLYLVGLPGVGKGTIVDIAAELVGRDAVATSSLNKLTGQFAIGPLIGKSLFVFDEMNAGHSTDLVEATRTFLSIVGNAPQSVDLKNRDAMPEVRLNGKALCTGNRLAKFADPSDAFGRRVLIVRIPKTAKRTDHGFKKRLVAESPGIMVWALFGLLDLWKTGGFVQPANGLELRSMFRRLSSRVAAFVEDCAVLQGADIGEEVTTGPLSVKASVLYDLFVKWSESKGMKPLIMEEFGADLASMTEDYAEDTMTVGGDQFSVWRGVRPRFVIDAKPRAEWTEEDLRASSSTVCGVGKVALVIGKSLADYPVPEAKWAPMGFNVVEEEEDQHLR